LSPARELLDCITRLNGEVGDELIAIIDRRISEVGGDRNDDSLFEIIFDEALNEMITKLTRTRRPIDSSAEQAG
jgi:hypothetical protein